MTVLSWVSAGQLEKPVLNDLLAKLLYRNFCSFFCLSMAGVAVILWQAVWSDTSQNLSALSLQHTSSQTSQCTRKQ